MGFFDKIFGKKEEVLSAEQWLSKGLEYHKSGDNANAFECFRKAKELGNREAEKFYGIFCWNGDGCKKNLTEAVRVLEHYCEDIGEEKTNLDDVLCFNLFSAYIQGEDDIEKNEEKAMKWCFKAAHLGHTQAQINLAVAYSQGNYGLTLDLNEALRWAAEANKSGDERAEKMLIFLNDKIDEYREKTRQAIELLSEGRQEEAFLLADMLANSGFDASQRLLGNMYQNGCGCETNRKKALYWLEKAAKQGNKRAMQECAELLFEEKQWDRALKWQYKLAIEGDEYEQKRAVILLLLSSNSTEEQLKKAFSWVNKWSEDGDSDAQMKLSHMYQNGIGCKADLEKALYWYEQAAENGESQIKIELAVTYFTGSLGEKNHKKGMEWAQKAGEQGDSRGWWIMCHEYEKWDLIKAEICCRKAAEMGNDEAINHLSELQQQIEENRECLERINEWEEKAENGSAEMKFYCGKLYEEGNVLPKSLFRASYWYEEAIRSYNTDKVNAEAQFRLAKLYLEAEDGVVQDVPRAFTLYKQAAQKGHIEAAYYTGLFYAEGVECEQDCMEAANWWEKAAEGGHKEAQIQLAINLQFNENGWKQDIPRALRWMKELAANDDMMALAIANYYLRGEMVQKNMTLAIYWFEVAAARGNVDAMYYAGSYRRDEKSESDRKQARYWLKLASEHGSEEAYLVYAHMCHKGEGGPIYVLDAVEYYLKAMESELYKDDEDMRKRVDKYLENELSYGNTLYKMLKQAENDPEQKDFFQLAEIYEDGKYAAPDPKKALYWYEKAINQSEKKALEHCVLCCEAIGDNEKIWDYAIRAAKLGVGYCQLKAAQHFRKEGNDAEAFHWYSEAVKRGMNEAKYPLAQYYETGEVCNKNPKLAIMYYEDRAMFEDDAVWRLIDIYEKGELGTKVNLKKAQKWLLHLYSNGNLEVRERLKATGFDLSSEEGFEFEWKLCQQGNTAAMCRVADRLLIGEGCDVNPEWARQWLMIAYEQNYGPACLAIGDFWNEGYLGEIDQETAVFWYKRGCKLDDMNCMNRLGYAYEFGYGCEKDINEAIYWYKKAAEMGHEVACNNLANIYRKGQSVEQDYVKSLYWYEQAYRFGCKGVAFYCGLYYKNGRGCIADLEKAIHWYEISVSEGDMYGCFNLALIYDKSSSPYCNKERSRELFLHAAGKGHAKSLYALGQIYDKGNDVPQDLEKAINYYRQAAEKGHEKAKARLTELNRAEVN